MTKQDTPRWGATIHYRAEGGSFEVTHDFEEIEDLHSIVERGPDWNTIERIEITLARKTMIGLTLEKAATL